MDEFIPIATLVVIFVYAAIAIWQVCKRRTIAGCVGTSAAFLCGSFFVVSYATVIATAIYYIIVVSVALLIIGWIFG